MNGQRWRRSGGTRLAPLAAVRTAVLGLGMIGAVGCVEREQPAAGASGTAMDPPTAAEISAAMVSDAADEADATRTTRGMACHALCDAAATAACGVAGMACVASSLVTIGGTAMPCALSVLTGCGAGLAGGTACAALCPP